MAYIYTDMAAVGRRLYTAINDDFVSDPSLTAMVLPLPAQWRAEALQVVCGGRSAVQLPEDSVRSRLLVLTLNGGSGAVRDLMAFLQADINPMGMSLAQAEKLSDEALQPVAAALGIPVGMLWSNQFVCLQQVTAEVLLLVRSNEADAPVEPLSADMAANLSQLCDNVRQRINSRGGFEVLLNFDLPDGVSMSSLLAHPALQALLTEARIGGSWRIRGNVQDGYTLSC